MPSVKYKELRAPAASEDRAAVRTRVMEARNRQHKKFTAEKNTYSSAQMAPKMIRKHCDADSVEPKHLSEAIQYRTLDRSYWA